MGSRVLALCCADTLYAVLSICNIWGCGVDLGCEVCVCMVVMCVGVVCVCRCVRVWGVCSYLVRFVFGVGCGFYNGLYLIWGCVVVMVGGCSLIVVFYGGVVFNGVAC